MGSEAAPEAKAVASRCELSAQTGTVEVDVHKLVDDRKQVQLYLAGMQQSCPAGLEPESGLVVIEPQTVGQLNRRPGGVEIVSQGAAMTLGGAKRF